MRVLGGKKSASSEKNLVSRDYFYIFIYVCIYIYVHIQEHTHVSCQRDRVLFLALLSFKYLICEQKSYGAKLFWLVFF